MFRKHQCLSYRHWHDKINQLRWRHSSLKRKNWAPSRKRKAMIGWLKTLSTWNQSLVLLRLCKNVSFMVHIMDFFSYVTVTSQWHSLFYTYKVCRCIYLSLQACVGPRFFRHSNKTSEWRRQYEIHSTWEVYRLTRLNEIYIYKYIYILAA